MLFAVIGPLLGRLLDRVGERVVFVAGSVVLGLGLILSGTSQSLWQMVLYYSLMASIGLAALSLGMHGVVLSRWFIRRRADLPSGWRSPERASAPLCLRPLASN